MRANLDGTFYALRAFLPPPRPGPQQEWWVSPAAAAPSPDPIFPAMPPAKTAVIPAPL